MPQSVQGKVFATLLRARLRWYAQATGRVLTRRWQTLVLVLGVLSPAAMPFLLQAKVLASPITNLFSAGHGPLWRFAHLMVLQTLALAWSGLQREAIIGGPFAGYSATLPVTPARQRSVDLTLLTLADGVLLVPVVTAVVLLTVGHAPASVKTFHMLAIGALVALTLALQLGHLEARWERVSGTMVGNLLLAASLTGGAAGAGWIVMTAAVAVALGSVAASLPSAEGRRGVGRWLRRRASNRRPLTGAVGTIALRIQLQALFDHQRAATLLRLGAATAVAFGADRLMGLERFDTRALPTGIFAVAAAALIVSGLFRSLQMAHCPMQSFLSALPVGRRFWAYRDTALVLCLGLLPLAVTLYPLRVAVGVALPRLLIIGVLYLALLALLRWPQLHGGRHGVLFSAVLAGLWAWPALAITT